jgi:plasmid stability protein
MAQLVVRNLDEDVKIRLRKRAERHGRSMEEEVRDILRAAVAAPEQEEGLGTLTRRRFGKSKVIGDWEAPRLRGKFRSPDFRR